MTLRSRLTLPFVFSVILGMAIAWWIAVTLVGEALERRLDTRLEHALDVIREDRFPLSEAVLARVRQLLEAEIFLIDGKGGLASGTADGIPAEIVRDLIASDLAPASNTPITARREGVRYRVVVRDLAAGAPNEVERVAVAASLADVDRAVVEARQWLGAAMLFSALLIGLLASRVARRIAAPLEHLAGIADRVSAGARDVAIRHGGTEEMRRLGTALESMVTKLREYEQEQARKTRRTAIDETTARLAHEIRNPLTAIKMQLQMLAEQVAAERRPVIAALLGEVERLELVIARALAIGDANAEPVRSPADLNALVREVARLIAPILEHRDIELALEAGDIPVVPMDPDQIKQVLINLVNNAIDELDRGGRLRILTRHDSSAGFVSVTVEDSGGGLSEGQLDRVQETLSSSRPFGLGLGLRICREILEAHGGQLAIEPGSSLGGARVTARIPARIID